MTYGADPYGGAGPPPATGPADLSTSADLSAAGALQYVEAPSPTALTGQGDLSAQMDLGRSGGSTATVEVAPEGVGTKVLFGTTAVVLVTPQAEVVRVPPYDVHPNTAPETNYVPASNVALASLLRDERREPPSGEGRQLVLLGSAPPSSGAEADESIFEIDHRG